MILRPYQQDMIQSVLASTARTSLIEAMTGLGKTVVFSHLAKHWSGNVLVLIHREELADQATQTLERVTGEEVGVEMGPRTTLDRSLMVPRIVVASVQSLTASRNARLKRLVTRRPSLVIVDECHHAAAGTWRRVLDHLPDARVVGVTATADRADKRGLGSVFEEVSYRYDAHAAIDDGWLVPVRCRSVRVRGLSYKGVRTTAGDLNGADLERVLTAERVPQGFAAGLHEFTRDGHKVLAFCPSVACAETVCEILNRREDGVAAFVSGTTPRTQRATIVDQFRDGTIRCLVNCSVFTEGFDVPDVSAIALCGGTKSRSKYVQMIGRGLRPLPGTVDGIDTAEERRERIASSPKAHCLIVDFAGDTGRHQLVGPLDVLADDSMPEATRQRVARALQDGGERSIEEAVEITEQEIEEQRRREAARRRKVVADVRLRVGQLIDPRRFDAIVPLPPAGRYEPPATERQVAMLAKQKIDTAHLTKRQANRLISEIIQRSKDGRCSIKQEQLIRTLGGTVDHVTTREEASREIDRLLGKPAHARATA